MRYEKRHIVRKRTDQLLYLELGDDNGGIILNLSEDGCNFQAIGPILEKELKFEFALGGGQQVHGQGQITWLDGTRKLGGLRFNGLSGEHRQQIRAWLLEVKAVEDTGEGFALAAAGAPVDSLAKLRRRQLREEARLQMEGVGEEGSSGSPEEQFDVEPSAARNYEDSLKAPATTLQGVVEEVFAHEEKKRAVVQPSRPSTPLTPERLQSLRSEILGLGEETRGVAQEGLLPPASQEQLAAHRTTAVSRGVAAIVAGAMLAAGAILYHREIGQSLIWLGAAMTGDRPGPKSATPNSAEATPGDSKNSARAIPDSATGSTPSQTLTTQPPRQLGTGVPPEGGTTGASLIVNQSLHRRDVRRSASSNTDDVQALWALVESGDTHAEVKLADHYARGDGVAKSCGQAKVLLNAAAKRGDLEAKRKLYELEQAGCR